MQSPALRILAVVTAVGLVALIVWTNQPPPAAPVPITDAIHAQSAINPNAAREVAIEDGKSIDFSKGTAEIQALATDQAAIQAALKEMQEATKNISFEAPPKATP